MGSAAASATAGTARVLRSLAVTTGAWHDGTLSGGQVAAVRRAVGRDQVETFAAQEGELVPGLVPLTVADTETVMRAWRDMADDAVHRVLRTGNGVILDYGRATRTVPAPLYNAVEIRDRGCRFPGCTLPPSRCDAHHVRFWARQGPTSIETSS